MNVNIKDCRPVRVLLSPTAQVTTEKMRQFLPDMLEFIPAEATVELSFTGNLYYVWLPYIFRAPRENVFGDRTAAYSNIKNSYGGHVDLPTYSGFGPEKYILAQDVYAIESYDH